MKGGVGDSGGTGSTGGKGGKDGGRGSAGGIGGEMAQCTTTVSTAASALSLPPSVYSNRNDDDITGTERTGLHESAYIVSFFHNSDPMSFLRRKVQSSHCPYM